MKEGGEKREKEESREDQKRKRAGLEWPSPLGSRLCLFFVFASPVLLLIVCSTDSMGCTFDQVGAESSQFPPYPPYLGKQQVPIRPW